MDRRFEQTLSRRYTDGNVCMLSCFSSVQLCSTLWTVARQAPLSMGFSRQEYRTGLPCHPPGDLPDLGTEPTSLMSPALACGFFITSAAWEAPRMANKHIKNCPTSFATAAAVAKSLQSCLTLCDPTDGSPPGSAVPGSLQARTLEWVAISFSTFAIREIQFKAKMIYHCCCSCC